MDNKFHYTYMIENTISNKKYIGVRSSDSTPELDTYMSSSKLVLKDISILGIDKFTKSIIKIHSTREEAYEHEGILVNKEWVLRNDTYNMVTGGRYYIPSNLDKSRLLKVTDIRHSKSIITYQAQEVAFFLQVSVNTTQRRCNKNSASYLEPIHGVAKFEEVDAIFEDNRIIDYSVVKEGEEPIKPYALGVSDLINKNTSIIYSASDYPRYIRNIYNKEYHKGKDFYNRFELYLWNVELQKYELIKSPINDDFNYKPPKYLEGYSNL